MSKFGQVGTRQKIRKNGKNRQEEKKKGNKNLSGNWVGEEGEGGESRV